MCNIDSFVAGKETFGEVLFLVRVYRLFNVHHKLCMGGRRTWTRVTPLDAMMAAIAAICIKILLGDFNALIYGRLTSSVDIPCFEIVLLLTPLVRHSQFHIT